MHIDVSRIALRDIGVVVRGDPNIDGGLTAAKACGGHSGVLKRLPGCLQHPTLLGVHAKGFARRDSEKLGVKLIEVVDEATPLRDHLAGDFHILVMPALPIPAIRRHRNDSGTTLDHHLPEGFGAVHATGETAADAYDSQRLV